MNLALVMHVFSTLFMTGAIWLVQILVYPNFKIVGSLEFRKFHEFHLNRITWVVAPVMTIELLTGAWLLTYDQTLVYWLNLVSVLFLWLYTGLINVPSHKRLNYNFEVSKSFLVLSNWPRTVVWSVRSMFWIWIVYANLEGGSK